MLFQEITNLHVSRVLLSFIPQLCGIPDDLQFRRVVDAMKDLFHALHDRIVEKVFATVLALQDWKPFQNHDRSLSNLEGEIGDQRLHSGTAHIASHGDRLLVLKSASHSLGSGE
jgi:hypothetical protein